jgi:hypothetical protein
VACVCLLFFLPCNTNLDLVESQTTSKRQRPSASKPPSKSRKRSKRIESPRSTDDDYTSEEENNDPRQSRNGVRTICILLFNLLTSLFYSQKLLPSQDPQQAIRNWLQLLRKEATPSNSSARRASYGASHAPSATMSPTSPRTSLKTWPTQLPKTKRLPWLLRNGTLR